MRHIQTHLTGEPREIFHPGWRAAILLGIMPPPTPADQRRRGHSAELPRRAGNRTPCFGRTLAGHPFVLPVSLLCLQMESITFSYRTDLLFSPKQFRFLSFLGSAQPMQQGRLSQNRGYLLVTRGSWGHSLPCNLVPHLCHSRERGWDLQGHFPSVDFNSRARLTLVQPGDLVRGDALCL